MATRRSKLREQQRERVASDVGILRNTRIYINGYLESTTDLEMKRIVVEAGGEIVQVRFTHSVEMVSYFPLLWQFVSLSVHPYRYIPGISWIEDP